jgi:DNA-binding CsgD family transcriptional regulator
MVDAPTLRPIERRILQLVDRGLDPAEIARRFRRSPDFVARVIDLTRLPGRVAGATTEPGGLRPLERRVLRWRDRGTTAAEIAGRFRRSPAHIEQVERLARYKLRAG